MGFKSNMYDTFLPSVYPSSVEYFLNSSDSNSSGSPDDFSGMSDSEDTSDELTYSNFGDFDMSSSDESTAWIKYISQLFSIFTSDLGIESSDVYIMN